MKTFFRKKAALSSYRSTSKEYRLVRARWKPCFSKYLQKLVIIINPGKFCFSIEKTLKHLSFQKIKGLSTPKSREAVYLDFPKKVLSKTTIIEVKLYYVNKAGEKLPRQLKEKMVSLTVLESRDYCTGNTFCELLAVGYMNEYKKHRSECLNIDSRSFGPKYGFCPSK